MLSLHVRISTVNMILQEQYTYVTGRGGATRGVGHLLEISLRLLVKFEMWNMKFEILLGYFRLLFLCTCCIFTRTDFLYV